MLEMCITVQLSFTLNPIMIKGEKTKGRNQSKLSKWTKQKPSKDGQTWKMSTVDTQIQVWENSWRHRILSPQPAVGFQEGPGSHWSHLGLHFDVFSNRCLRGGKKRALIDDWHQWCTTTAIGPAAPARPVPIVRDAATVGQGQKEDYGFGAWRGFAL